MRISTFPYEAMFRWLKSTFKNESDIKEIKGEFQRTDLASGERALKKRTAFSSLEEKSTEGTLKQIQ